MYKMLCATLFAVSLPFLVWGLAAQGFFASNDKTETRSTKAVPLAGQSGGVLRGPRVGSVGVTYTTGATAPSVDPPAGARLRIYTITSDGKSFTIHGFNKSGFHLSLASDGRLRKIGGSTRFDRSITFSDQYPNGAKTVGTLTGSGNVWAARSWFGAMWLSSWSHSAAPPVLPRDGESVTVLATKLQKGNDALWLNFQTDSSNGTSFLIVGTQKKDQTVERDR